jgi:probable HAF family extracellular repeat protein
MRYHTFQILLVGLVFSLVATHSASGSPAALNSMKLLTANTGWASSAHSVSWTTDAGKNWKDITPQRSPKALVGDVFFLDISMGWVLLSHSNENDERQFEIAFTEDSGATWSSSPVILPWERYVEDFSGGGSIYFIDRHYGWAMLGISSATLARGRLLFTQDGGKTWKPTKDDPGSSGPLCFFDKGNGILTGGLLNTELWLTHDASASWQQVSLQAPAQALPANDQTYGLPLCTDEKHGFLPVTFTPAVYHEGESYSTALVLFATDDAGRHWRVDKMLNALPDRSHGSLIASSVIGSTLEAVARVQQGSSLFTIGPDRKTAVRTTTLEPVFIISFADHLRGWALTEEGLFATMDGGESWTNISPQSVTLETFQATNRSQLGITNISGPPTGVSGIPTTQAAEARMGFDRGRVPSTNDMLAWWQHSPYFDYQVSLPGAANHPKDRGLDSSWITAVQNYGWGLWPLWFGPQAPCTNNQKLKKIDKTKDAYKQGQGEAKKAISILTKLNTGFAGTIIYYDMENYNTKDRACGDIVVKFLNGWVNGLQAGGFKTGVYGNPDPAAKDFSRVKPLPDDVWITWGPVDSPPNVADVSIWGLKPRTGRDLCDPFTDKKCNPFLWSTGQRIHQYVIDNPPHHVHMETWGNVPLEIDPDIVDAAVASPSTQAKNSYTFDFTSIDYPNAKLTNALGLNDAGGGKLPQVVGYWYFVSNSPFGFVANPPYGQNDFTMLEYPNSIRTAATGINSAGQVSGYYVDSNFNFFGFMVSPPYSDQDYSQPISLGNGTLTIAEGVNDAGQIIGYYQDTNGLHGFLYNTVRGNIVNPIDDGGSSTLRGVNGDAMILGIKQGSNSFLYDAVTGATTDLGFTAFGVNSNLEMVGGDTLYDYPTGSQVTIGMPTGATSAGAFGINDYSSIAGVWSDSNGVQHGFLATPKQQ